MEARILLVEDDARIRQALGLALADEGCQVVEAGSGEQALKRLGSTAIDLVLLDLMLPGMDGLEVCRSLRSRGDLPIIIVTARSDTTDVINGLEAGADDYVTKSLVASELAARIRALLRRRRPDRLRIDMEAMACGCTSGQSRSDSTRAWCAAAMTRFT
jgi:two-component system, OmpR family, response regulator MtrA